MALDERIYSVGELAKATGLTVRALQHYDNIGLLPPSGRTEGGRRYYTDHDMMKLSQIVFYRSLGIPLSEIRDTPTPVALEAVFNQHLTLMLMKMDSLNVTLSVLRSTIDLLHSGDMPPFETLAQLIRGMEGSGLSTWVMLALMPDEEAERPLPSRPPRKGGHVRPRAAPAADLKAKIGTRSDLSES